jgi:hypothetical protein
MNIDIPKELLAQEDEIQLPYFNNQTARELGIFPKTYTRSSSLPDIELQAPSS